MSKIAKYKTVDDVVAAFATRSRKLCKEMLEYAWDLGVEIKKITEEAAYGEGAIKIIMEQLSIGQSTLYAYRQFHAAYPDRDGTIQRFSEAGVPFRTIYKLLSVPDEMRPVVEEKLLSGEINEDGVDTIKKTLKEEEAERKIIEENESSSGLKAEAEAPEADVAAAKKIKAPLHKITNICEKLEDAFHKSEGTMQDMDLIGDTQLYESVQDVMGANVDSVRSLFKVAEHWKDRLRSYIPEAIDGSK